MTDINELLDRIEITPKLIYYIDVQYKKMMNQLRFSLGRLNGITSVEVNRLFNLTDITQEDLTDFMELYPANVYIMRQPIYNLLTLIIIKALKEGNERLALDTNTLLGLVFLGRLKYHYLKFIDQPILEKALNNMNKKSYIGLHGMIWMINHITKSTFDKWMPLVMQDINQMYPRYRYIIDLKNKLNQIMKTIAHQYYYQILHRNDVDRSVIIKNRTNEIMEYITSKSIPSNLFEYAVKLCSNNTITDTDKISKLHYNVQTYQSLQLQMSLLIYNILDRLFAVMTYYKDQYQKNIDINDFEWLKSFFTGLKRSTIILKNASDTVFTTYNFDRFEVIAYALVITLFVDSLNHNTDYYGTSNNISNNDNMEAQYNYYDKNDDYSDDNSNLYESYDFNINDMDEQLEGLFEGFMIDKELFELFSNEGDD